MTDGDTITNGGADIITNFVAGTDIMDTTDGTAAVVVTSGGTYDNTVNGGNVIVRGDFVAATGVFTINTAAGADAMFMDLTAAISNANPNGSGTAVTVFQGSGADIAAIAAGNWA